LNYHSILTIINPSTQQTEHRLPVQMEYQKRRETDTESTWKICGAGGGGYYMRCKNA